MAMVEDRDKRDDKKKQAQKKKQSDPKQPNTPVVPPPGERTQTYPPPGGNDDDGGSSQHMMSSPDDSGDPPKPRKKPPEITWKWPVKKKKTWGVPGTLASAALTTTFERTVLPRRANRTLGDFLFRPPGARRVRER